MKLFAVEHFIEHEPLFSEECKYIMETFGERSSNVIITFPQISFGNDGCCFVDGILPPNIYCSLNVTNESLRLRLKLLKFWNCLRSQENQPIFSRNFSSCLHTIYEFHVTVKM